MKRFVPWWARIAGKLVLSRLPVAYGSWKRLGIFAHGHMEQPGYASEVFRTHFERAGMAGRAKGFVGLEMGPGDSVASAVIAKAFGATNYYLVDVGEFAAEDTAPLRQVARSQQEQGYSTPELEGVSDMAEVLRLCNASYLTDNLASYATIPDGSIDFIWSHAVLEHVRKGEFLDVMREVRRILKPDGVSTHQVDLRDHLGGFLNNMRLDSSLWEADWMAHSGFYTNRIRMQEMCRLFEVAGFDVEIVEKTTWDTVPIKHRRLAPEFRHLADADLLVSGFFVRLRPRASAREHAPHSHMSM